ncbi:MAG: TetR/AcrR family transcriptional regulator [Deltaproteobacteria bacterium]|nr:TetR/AcrR family transcriptional regulator [Deltaproteobacteria bacterium]
MAGTSRILPVDGRLDRRVKSRLAICDACLDLVEDGVLQPSADEIAERADVSRRSIFNHFRDLAELSDAVVEVGMQRCAPLLKKISEDEPIGQRLERFCEVRSAFLEATVPFTRSLTVRILVGNEGEQAWRVTQDALRLHGEEIKRLFRRELTSGSKDEQLETVEALAAATSPLTWEVLRHSQGLSMARARSVMKRTLTALLRDAGVEL